MTCSLSVPTAHDDAEQGLHAVSGLGVAQVGAAVRVDRFEVGLHRVVRLSQRVFGQVDRHGPFLSAQRGPAPWGRTVAVQRGKRPNMTSAAEWEWSRAPEPGRLPWMTSSPGPRSCCGAGMIPGRDERGAQAGLVGPQSARGPGGHLDVIGARAEAEAAGRFADAAGVAGLTGDLTREAGPTGDPPPASSPEHWRHDPRAPRSDGRPPTTRAPRRSAAHFRRGDLPRPQRSRTMLRPSQAVPRHRDPVRQARRPLPRRSRTGLPHPLAPRTDQMIICQTGSSNSGRMC